MPWLNRVLVEIKMVISGKIGSKKRISSAEISQNSHTTSWTNNGHAAHAAQRMPSTPISASTAIIHQKKIPKE